MCVILANGFSVDMHNMHCMINIQCFTCTSIVLLTGIIMCVIIKAKSKKMQDVLYNNI